MNSIYLLLCMCAVCDRMCYAMCFMLVFVFVLFSFPKDTFPFIFFMMSQVMTMSTMIDHDDCFGRFTHSSSSG